jgi:hypothetical protein
MSGPHGQDHGTGRAPVVSRRADRQAQGVKVIYEVRDYHLRPDVIEDYRAWATEAVVVLRQHLDVVGFWIDDGAFAPEIEGTDPVDSPIGSANVTWIIRWASKATRDAEIDRVFEGETWRQVWSRHPDPNAYRQSTSRFMTAL